MNDTYFVNQLKKTFKFDHCITVPEIEFPEVCMTKSVAHATNDDPGKPCVFPFISNSNTYNECEYGVAGPWCATEVDANGHMGSKYGFCNTACPGGVFVGPSDVSGTCTLGSSQITKTVGMSGLSVNVDHCCCGDEDCCWERCTRGAPPEHCLPPGAEWKLNVNGYFQAVQAG